MRTRTILLSSAGIALLGSALAAAFLTQETWRDWLFPATGATEEDHHHDRADRIRLSPQARKNLGIVVEAVQPVKGYQRNITVPGTVVERPGNCDRLVTAPLAGIVTHIAAVPGDVVAPGDPLFTLRILSEPLQNSQTELYKTTRELQTVEDQRKRLAEGVKSGAVSVARMIELDAQHRRLTAAQEALQHDLTVRGLTPEQVRQVAQGRFVTAITVPVPRYARAQTAAVSSPEPDSDDPGHNYEVEELKVVLGAQVQVGQELCRLADHHELFIEGRAFKSEALLVQRAAANGWGVTAEFPQEAGTGWSPLGQKLTIRFLGNTVDPASQTVPFYVLLPNEARRHQNESGRTHISWRFRPGQRVRLQVPVQQVESSVFVLPAGAVVREGADAFIFRQNGDLFERRPVHVLYEDRRQAVIDATDGSLTEGTHVVQGAAVQLNWALKAQQSGGEGHGHEHHHH